MSRLWIRSQSRAARDLSDQTSQNTRFPGLLGRNHRQFQHRERTNLSGLAERAGGRLQILRLDINETDRLREAFRGVRYVFHQAAIPSVPRSIADPRATERANISGTLSMLIAARDAGVRKGSARLVIVGLRRRPGPAEAGDRVGRPLSPYALSKAVCEHYARLFLQLYGLETVCLRYFNVFGPRQNPKSEYSAVIPRFATRLLARQAPIIYGDGEQTRDFTFVTNVVDANWKAATHPRAAGEVLNIGCGARTSLNQLVAELGVFRRADRAQIRTRPRRRRAAFARGCQQGGEPARIYPCHCAPGRPGESSRLVPPPP